MLLCSSDVVNGLHLTDSEEAPFESKCSLSDLDGYFIFEDSCN